MSYYYDIWNLYTAVLCVCSVVIMEGDPHPGAAMGRMSFQSFNPSVDVSIKVQYLNIFI